MLTRVLEPEAMDTPDEARDYDAMDHAAVNERFVADFLAAHGPCRGGRILDVGTGTGILAIAAAKMCPKPDRAEGPTIIACDTDEDAITIPTETILRAAKMLEARG